MSDERQRLLDYMDNKKQEDLVTKWAPIINGVPSHEFHLYMAANHKGKSYAQEWLDEFVRKQQEGKSVVEKHLSQPYIKHTFKAH